MKLKGQEIRYITEMLNITTGMLSAFNLRKLLKQILDTSLELLGADTGSLMLVEEQNSTLKIRAARGLNAEVAEKVHVKIGEQICGWVAEHGEPLLLVGGLKNDRRFTHLDEKKEIKSAISVPLKVESRVIGVLNANSLSSQTLFNESDLKILSLLANQAAISIWNVRLYEEARQANEEIKLMQQQLIEREKMAVLGQFSTGIAHEINNPLATILGNAQYIMENMKESSFGWEEVKDIKDAAELASRIISRLFKYCSRPENPQELVDANEAIREITKLIKTQFDRQAITINLNLKSPLPKILISPDELKEVILNIVLNAKSAMPKGGTLAIETNCAAQDDTLEMIFSDTGQGIPEGIIDKIFEPFFTTRKPHGAGLGLTICQRIIRANRGSIKVNSQLGKGTTFTIRLPAAKTTG